MKTRSRWSIAAVASASVLLLNAHPALSNDVDLGTCAEANGVHAGVLEASDPTFGRPSTGVFPPFGTDTPSCDGSNAYEYDSYTFEVLTGGSLAVRAQTIAGGDTFLAIYYSPGDSTPFPGANTTDGAACVNVAAADDDSGGNLLSLITLPNAPAGWYTVVVTSYGTSPTGAYQLQINCGNPQGAPTLSVWGLVAAIASLFLLGIVGMRRRSLI